MPEHRNSPDGAFLKYLSTQRGAPTENWLGHDRISAPEADREMPCLALGALVVGSAAIDALSGPSRNPEWTRQQEERLLGASHLLTERWPVLSHTALDIAAAANAVMYARLAAGEEAQVILEMLPSRESKPSHASVNGWPDFPWAESPPFRPTREGIEGVIRAADKLHLRTGPWLSAGERDEFITELYGDNPRPQDMMAGIILPLVQLGVIEMKGHHATRTSRWRIVGLAAREQMPILHPPDVRPRAYFTRPEALILIGMLRKLMPRSSKDDESPRIPAAVTGSLRESVGPNFKALSGAALKRIRPIVANKVEWLATSDRLLWGLSRTFRADDPRQTLLAYIAALPKDYQFMKRFKQAAARLE